MGEFAYSPLQSRPADLATRTRDARTSARPARVTRMPLSMPRTLGNQGVQRLLQVKSDGLQALSSTKAVTPFVPDFGQMSVYHGSLGTIQAKLEVSPPGDIYEQEADRVADQVMRTPEPRREHACACGGRCSECQVKLLDQEHEYLQAHRVGPSDVERSAALSIAHEVLAGAGQPLDSATRSFMEPRFGHHFGQVRVHTGAAAEQSAQEMNAHAYTVGRDIVFGAGRFAPGTQEGRRLIAHELTHVVQHLGGNGKGVGQSNGDSGPSRILHVPEAIDAEAKENPQAVTAPGRITWLSRATPQVARQPIEQTREQSSPADRFIETLNRKLEDPYQFTNDMAILSRLSMKGKLKTLEEIRSKGYLDRAIDRFYGFPNLQIQPDPVTPELWAAAFTVKWTSTDADKGSIEQAEHAAVAISSISTGDQNEILDYLKAHSTTSKQVSLTTEGISAFAEEQSGVPVTTEITDPEAERFGEGAYGGVTFGGVVSAPPSITPEPFAPPGRQWPGFYIGNEAHAAIAHVYDSAHLGDMTFYNRFAMSTILRATTRMGVKADPTALTSVEQELEPDITNLSRHHLYEIKSVRALGQAITEAEMYMGLFNAAGVPMSLGPTTERGTRGAFPAPGGVFIFESPAPGAIVYRYRRGQALVPERVPATAGEPARWRYVLKPWQKAAIVGTAVVGTGLIILMVLLSPLGV